MAASKDNPVITLLKKSVGLPTGSSSCCSTPVESHEPASTVTPGCCAAAASDANTPAESQDSVPAANAAAAASSSCCGAAASAPASSLVSCCGTSPAASVSAGDPNSADTIHEAVRDRYANIAKTRAIPESEKSCGCGSTLYSPDMLESLPDQVTGLSLGCGDPITLADLRPGDTVIDLGAGGGIDCFLAAQRVGAEGRVIGVDMTPEMIERARANAARLKVANVEFRQGQIESLPVEDGTADVIISNCVINLSPDKPQVFREMMRALKPGGRVAVSDIVTSGTMPQALRNNMEAWGACISGAIPGEEYAAGLQAAGFVDVQVKPKGSFDAALTLIPVGTPFSALITARKP